MPTTIQTSLGAAEVDAGEEETVTHMTVPDRVKCRTFESPWMGKIIGRVIILGIIAFSAQGLERVVGMLWGTRSLGVDTGLRYVVSIGSGCLYLVVVYLLVITGIEFFARTLAGASSGPDTLPSEPDNNDALGRGPSPGAEDLRIREAPSPEKQPEIQLPSGEQGHPS